MIRKHTRPPANASCELRATSGWLRAASLFLVTAGLGMGAMTAMGAAGQYIKLETSDSGDTFYVGRCFRTNILVQTDNLDANSVDIILPYNSAYVQPYTNSGCTVAATAAITHDLFPSYPSNTIVNDEVLVTGYDPSGSDPANTGAAPADEILGYLYWKVLSASGAFTMHYDFTAGSTTDTNMAENGGDGTDVLEGVENMSLTLAADTGDPTFSSLVPASGATDVSVTSNLSLVVADDEAGVDSSSIAVTLNGDAQTEANSCTTGNSNTVPSCTTTVDFPVLAYNTTYTVAVSADDLASPTANNGSANWQFTTEDDDDAPYVQNLSPVNGATGVATSSNITFNVKDYKNQAGSVPGLGVDIDSVEVTVTVGANAPVTYENGDPEFSVSGTSANYAVTINPASDFPENTVVQVSIDAEDLHGTPNVMTTVNASFTTVDSGDPVIADFSPAQDATDVEADTDISFTLSDDGAGIDIHNTTVTVEGTSYDSGDAAFAYSGTAAAYTVTIDPAANFTGGQVVNVTIETQDLASTPNTVSTSYSFTIANVCTTCAVEDESPERFTTSAAETDTITFHVTDDGDGIEEDAITVTLAGTGTALSASPLTLTGGSVGMTISGSPADYLVTITLASAIEENKPISITIDATDVNGLNMHTVAYTVARLSSTEVAVQCPACNCSDTTADTGGGGTRGSLQDRIVRRIESGDLPQIIARRRLPSGVMQEEVLSPERSREIDRCYVDETDHAAAPRTPYADVAAGAWYEDAAAAFVERGILDVSQPLLRPSDAAVRAETAKLLAAVRGVAQSAPTQPSFDDTAADTWYYAFVETAAREGWMKGYGNCYGQTRPCMAQPASAVTRAEAAAMIVRAFQLEALGLAPRFRDIAPEAWYGESAGIAADHCILQGDDATGLLAPERRVARAELIVMLHRAEQNLRHGEDCGAQTADNADDGASPYGGSLLASHTGANGILPNIAILCLIAPFLVPLSRMAKRIYLIKNEK